MAQSMITILLLLVGCTIGLRPTTTPPAQADTPDLVVSVRDAQGAGLGGINVQILGGADTPPLAQATTDDQGQAVFAGITLSQVRVRLSGRLANGAQLVQPGLDAAGIAVWLGPPPTRLDLRVETNGLVLPDPTSMRNPSADGPLVATRAPDQEARIVLGASAAVVPAAAEVVPFPPPHAPAGAAETAPAGPVLLEWLGWLLVLLVVGGALALAFALRRRPE